MAPATAAKVQFCLSAPSQQCLAASQEQQQQQYGHSEGLSFQLRQSSRQPQPLFASLTLSAAAADAVS
jgi:hypothetical protein